MPEIPDVVTGEVIASTWGNDIRDRAVQRYANAATRTASVPAPEEGALSYLLDTNLVYVYDGAAWVTINPVTLGSYEVDGYAEVSTFVLTSIVQTVATVNLTIPAGWATWKCTATATWMYDWVSGTIDAASARLMIDGTALQALVINNGPAGDQMGALVGQRTGMTTTGSRAINLQAAEGASTVAELHDIALYARAVRTS